VSTAVQLDAFAQKGAAKHHLEIEILAPIAAELARQLGEVTVEDVRLEAERRKLLPTRNTRDRSLSYLSAVMKRAGLVASGPHAPLEDPAQPLQPAHGVGAAGRGCTMTSCPHQARALRPELPALPANIARLPVDERGYPVPWFVAWIDGKPEFRVADAKKIMQAVVGNLCWVCGSPLGRYLAFVVGPMCAVNRISAEPPSHLECAEFSVRACLFLVRPHMRRRERGLPAEAAAPPGHMIRRNPGVTLIWVTRVFKPTRVDGGGWLYQMGAPTSLLSFAEGRAATEDEVLASIESGLPLLREAAGDDPEQLREIEIATAEAYELLKVSA
jgi:hypothetical protein